MGSRESGTHGGHPYRVGSVGLQPGDGERGIVYSHGDDAVLRQPVGHILQFPTGGCVALTPRNGCGIGRDIAGGIVLHARAVGRNFQLDVVHVEVPVVVNHTFDGHKGAVAGVAVQADDKVAIGGVGDGHRAHRLEGVDVVGVGHHSNLQDWRGATALIGPERDLQGVDGVDGGVHTRHHEGCVGTVPDAGGGGVPIHVFTATGGVVVACRRGDIGVVVLVSIGATYPTVGKGRAAGGGGRCRLEVHHVGQRVHRIAISEYVEAAPEAGVVRAADACH